MKSYNINFKKMQADDLSLLHKWFHIPHVLRWYCRDKEYTLAMIQVKYLPRINDSSFQSFIIFNQDTPVGYIQLYHVTDHLPEGVDNYTHPLFGKLKPEEIAGIDLFIADETILRKGISSKVLKNFIEGYIEGKFKAAVVDPLKININAVRFFERNGFERLPSTVDEHHLLMMRLI